VSAGATSSLINQKKAVLTLRREEEEEKATSIYEIMRKSYVVKYS